jgi:hypothetical protein
MSSPSSLVQTFKNSLIEFLDQLIDMFPNESNIVIVRVMVKDVLVIEDLLISFKTGLEKEGVRDMIKDHNDQYFMRHDTLFSNIGSSNINEVKRLWQSGSIDAYNKTIVWAWIDRFVKVADLHTKALGV